jgi:hypothetical protein
MSAKGAVMIEVAVVKVLRRLAATAGTGALLVVLAVPAWAGATTCSTAALAALAVPSVSITSATPVAATSTAPAHCDVLGSVATDGEGAGPNVADFDVKLPDAWNHKFVFMGVGGLAGSLNPSINPVDRALSLVKGYATAVTTTGHVTATDPLWMLGSPGVKTNKVIDYYYRAAHQVGIAAKLLVKAYYGTSTIARSYFDGCSNGGKMGLLEAVPGRLRRDRRGRPVARSARDLAVGPQEREGAARGLRSGVAPSGDRSRGERELRRGRRRRRRPDPEPGAVLLRPAIAGSGHAQPGAGGRAEAHPGTGA